MKTTNKQRIAEYDAVKAGRDKLDLAAYDLLNGAFSAPERKYYRHYDSSEAGHIEVRMSWRAMPLFAVRFMPSKSMSILTETELADFYRERHTYDVTARMLWDARSELMAAAKEGGRS